jgi:hypothetical protein
MPLKGGRYANGSIELAFFVNGTGASVGMAMDGLSGCLRRATPPTLAPRFDYSRADEVPEQVRKGSLVENSLWNRRRSACQGEVTLKLS